MDYDKFIDKYGLSPSRPEAYYAELAANEIDKRWISVNERLPDKDSKVLIIDENGGRFSGNGVVVLKNINLVDTKTAIHTRYTHWMLFPDLPCKN